jgi:putative membrane protein
VYVGVASLALSVAAVGISRAGVAFVLTFATAVLSSSIIARTSKLSDQTSIASFRRSAAAVFAGEMVWFVCSGVGTVYSFFQASGHSAGNSVIFGGFVCAGFEFLVVNGAFIQRAATSAILSAVHPLVTALAFFAAGGISYDAWAVAFGVVAFAVPVLFTLALRRRRTSLGYNAVRLFQAFMKTWANDDAAELETIIDAHASVAKVSTKLLRFRQDDGDTFVILPGVHPGPFYPVGSYNLPGLVSRSFEGLGRVLTLHGPGGHESNLATNASTKRYVEDLRNFAETIQPMAGEARIQGPLVAKIGKATASASAFGKNLLLAISFAPYGSDDLESEAGRRLAAIAESQGYDALLVDAHNSIDDGREQLDLKDEGWTALIQGAKESSPEQFRIGYAHSKEIGLAASSDLTTNGIALMLLEVDGTKWALVLADANNAVPGLRESVSRALESAGYRLLEYCTSDSHDLAARGLTADRGYHALGEVTPLDVIASATVKLASLAESRLATCRYGFGNMVSEARIFGSTGLREFAEVTQRSSRFARAYARFAAPAMFALLIASLVA